MKKTMKNLEMVDTVNGLTEFVKKDKSAPIALSVSISANLRKLRTELEPYEEARQKLLREKPENMEDEFKELLNLDVEMEIRTVAAELLEGLDLSTRDYIALEFMIE